MTMLAMMAISRKFGHLPLSTTTNYIYIIYIREDGQLTILTWKVAKMAKFICMTMLAIFKVEKG